MPLPNYIPLCNALAALLKPLIEIVIHDLVNNTVCYINGNLSKRQVGDPSLLEVDTLEKNLDQIIYPKINFDGRLVKSISVPIENKWLICINCDVSIFSQMQEISKLLLNMEEGEKPESLFKKDWQEKLHVSVHNFLQEQGWKFSELKNKQKKIIVKHLFHSGAFAEKHAADYIAQVLQLGRATVFNYLKALKET